MASPHKVKEYIAVWFQLGKKLWFKNSQFGFTPNSIIDGDRYSAEFENCWQQLMETEGKDCYLEGVEPTIEVLLSPKWTISQCATCSMPVPLPELGIGNVGCPCQEFPLWPNTELPYPRSPIKTQDRLKEINNRLKSKAE